jgi:predicted AAA+ superfamily ATPase
MDLKKSIIGDAELFDLVKSNLGEGRNYVFIDEIQNVPEWESAAVSIFTELDVDLYITGSNAMMLSSDLSTKLVGRQIVIQVFPLSFGEIYNFRKENGLEKTEVLNEYLIYGGFPGVTVMPHDERNRMDVIDGIYRSIISSDVILKNNVRDPALMFRISEFLLASIGNIVSAKSISDYLSSNGIKTTPATVENYLSMLEQSYLLYRVKRFDVADKHMLKTLNKYYAVDLGIRNAEVGSGDRGRMLENLVYFELLRRGYKVTVGKVGQQEIDFVASKQQNNIYIQVSQFIADEDARRRETSPLLAIKDAFPKILITEHATSPTGDGIICITVTDFLLGQEL